MTIDLITGLVKSWKKGRNTTSKGFKGTAIKIGTYSGIVVAASLMANVLADMYPPIDYDFYVNLTVAFLTFVEVYSILENVYETDPKSTVSVYFIGPVLKWMKGYMKKKGPASKLPDLDKDKDEA